MGDYNVIADGLENSSNEGDGTQDNNFPALPARQISRANEHLPSSSGRDERREARISLYSSSRIGHNSESTCCQVDMCSAGRNDISPCTACVTLQN